tara:strand:- start:466 stop:804 length:339 start_codon:yes stop_codon:yes gene_type:complete
MPAAALVQYPHPFGNRPHPDDLSAIAAVGALPLPQEGGSLSTLAPGSTGSDIHLQAVPQHSRADEPGPGPRPAAEKAQAEAGGGRHRETGTGASETPDEEAEVPRHDGTPKM